MKEEIVDLKKIIELKDQVIKSKDEELKNLKKELGTKNQEIDLLRGELKFKNEENFYLKGLYKTPRYVKPHEVQGEVSLFIGNIPDNHLGKVLVKNFFAGHGISVRSVKVMKHKHFGFVNFADNSELLNALTLQGRLFGCKYSYFGKQIRRNKLNRSWGRCCRPVSSERMFGQSQFVRTSSPLIHQGQDQGMASQATDRTDTSPVSSNLDGGRRMGHKNENRRTAMEDFRPSFNTSRNIKISYPSQASEQTQNERSESLSPQFLRLKQGDLLPSTSTSTFTHTHQTNSPRETKQRSTSPKVIESQEMEGRTNQFHINSNFNGIQEYFSQPSNDTKPFQHQQNDETGRPKFYTPSYQFAQLGQKDQMCVNNVQRKQTFAESKYSGFGQGSIQSQRGMKQNHEVKDDDFFSQRRWDY